MGATASLSAGLELNTPMGIAQLVAKKNENDQVTEYKGDKPAAARGFDANITANAEVFAGAKAEASASVAVEWKNPEKTASKFGLLASVGGMISGCWGWYRWRIQIRLRQKE